MAIIHDIIIVLVLMLVLDAIWIGSNTKMYRTMIEGIQRSKMNVNIVAAAVVYFFMVILMVFIVLPYLRQFEFSFWNCVKIAGLVGLSTYAIYNFTNMATFTNYHIKVALLDSLWGGTLFTLVSFMTLWITMRITK